jgi:hypothetical protein
VRDYSLAFPAHVDEEASLIEARGWLAGVTIQVGDGSYPLEFYDPVRLAQTVADDLRTQGMSVLDNVVIVHEVTVTAIRAAVRQLAEQDFAALRALAR